jgi:hypothetical protein
MQDTRINNLTRALWQRGQFLLFNPWRRLSLLAIGWLLGVFLSSVISTTMGQSAQWDITAAAIVATATEAITWWVYRQPSPAATAAARERLLTGLNFQPSDRELAAVDRFPRTLVNFIKIGCIYGLFLEAFKLGS